MVDTSSGILKRSIQISRDADMCEILQAKGCFDLCFSSIILPSCYMQANQHVRAAPQDHTTKVAMVRARDEDEGWGRQKVGMRKRQRRQGRGMQQYWLIAATKAVMTDLSQKQRRKETLSPACSRIRPLAATGSQRSLFLFIFVLPKAPFAATVLSWKQVVGCFPLQGVAAIRMRKCDCQNHLQIKGCAILVQWEPTLAQQVRPMSGSRFARDYESTQRADNSTSQVRNYVLTRMMKNLFWKSVRFFELEKWWAVGHDADISVTFCGLSLLIGFPQLLLAKQRLLQDSSRIFYKCNQSFHQCMHNYLIFPRPFLVSYYKFLKGSVLCRRFWCLGLCIMSCGYLQWGRRYKSFQNISLSFYKTCHLSSQ